MSLLVYVRLRASRLHPDICMCACAEAGSPQNPKVQKSVCPDTHGMHCRCRRHLRFGARSGASLQCTASYSHELHEVALAFHCIFQQTVCYTVHVLSLDVYTHAFARAFFILFTHASRHSCIHTSILTYLHTYTLTYTHTCMRT